MSPLNAYGCFVYWNFLSHRSLSLMFFSHPKAIFQFRSCLHRLLELRVVPAVALAADYDNGTND